MHLHGDTHTRGFQYGYLMAEQVEAMMDDMDTFYRQEVDQIPWGKLKLPSALQRALETTLKDAAPTVFKSALSWVFEQQRPHLDASPSQPLVEIEGIAAGICAKKGGLCDRAK